MNKNSTTRTFDNGKEIPMVGFGTYLVSNEQAESVVSDALQLGYRHIDTAEAYENEEGVGTAIQKQIEAGKMKRDEIFVTTKLWPGNAQWGQTPKTTESTIQSLFNSLEKLQLEYVDLYLVHAPYDPAQRLEQWKGMVELQKQGKAQSIGVSNFSEQHIEQIKAAGLPLPAVNQVELHPWSQKPRLVDYLQNEKILPIAYSSLAPLSTWRIEPGQDSAKTEQMKADGENSVFKKMAEKYGVTEAQVLLRWAVQMGYPVLPKSLKVDRMKKNIDLFSFEIDDTDMSSILTMDRGDGVAWAIGDPTRVD